MIPLMLNEVSAGRLDLGRLVNAMSEAPASRLGLERGKIAEGFTADFFVVNLKQVDPIDVVILNGSRNHYKDNVKFFNQILNECVQSPDSSQ